MAREDEIKMIAYQIWEEEGRPEGRDAEQWLKAEAIWERNHKKAPGAAQPAPAAISASKSKPAQRPSKPTSRR